MQKKKGLLWLVTAALAGTILLCGGLSVYAEPINEAPAEEPYYAEPVPAEEQQVEPPSEQQTEYPAVLPEPELSPEPSLESADTNIPDDTVTTDQTPDNAPVHQEPEDSSSQTVYTAVSDISVIEQYPYQNQPTVHQYQFTYTEPYYDDVRTVENSYQYEPDHDTYGYMYTADEYDDDNTNTAESEWAPPPDTSALDISGYEISEVETLTSHDWEDLKKAQNSRFEMNPTPTAHTNGAFAKLKQDSRGGNDDWVFLVGGIVLISFGIIAIGVVIWTSIRVKKKMR